MKCEFIWTLLEVDCIFVTVIILPFSFIPTDSDLTPRPFPHIVTFSAHLAYLHSISPSLTVGLPAYFNNTNHIPCACRLYSTFWRSKWHRKYGRHLRSVPLLHWNWRLCTGYSQPIHYREKGEKIILSTGGVSKIAGKRGSKQWETKSCEQRRRHVQHRRRKQCHLALIPQIISS